MSVRCLAIDEYVRGLEDRRLQPATRARPGGRSRPPPAALSFKHLSLPSSSKHHLRSTDGTATDLELGRSENMSTASIYSVPREARNILKRFRKAAPSLTIELYPNHFRFQHQVRRRASRQGCLAHRSS